MFKVFVLFFILCIPLVWFYAEYEESKPKLNFYEIVEPEPQIEEPIIEKEQKNLTFRNETEQNLSIPVNITIELNETIEINQTSNETNITLPYFPKIGILNQQNSQKAVNNIDYINRYWNTVVFYTDSECYIRINPNLNEKDWIYYITTFKIPLHYQMDKKYCHLIQTNF
jgi:hypothetical protein